MLKLILLIIIVYLIYVAYATYKMRGNSFNPLDDYFAAYIRKVQFWN